MSKHSKRHNIKHKKAIQDAKKSKIYTKVAKLIEMAARNGSDPAKNPALEVPLQKAKYYGVPKTVIDKALAKGAGNDKGDQLQEIVYEGYGPGGVAVMVKTITSNKNRTAATMKLLFSRYGGSLGEPGSVGWQFSERSIFFVNGLLFKEVIKGNNIDGVKPLDINSFEEYILNLPILDYSIGDNQVKIEAQKTDFHVVQTSLKNDNYNIDYADIEFIPTNFVSVLDDEISEKLDVFLDMLDDDDDVEQVFNNAE